MREHARAKSWLDSRLGGTVAVGLPWPSLMAFVRLISNPRMVERPETVESAWRQVESWLDSPCAWIPGPTERHRELVGRLLLQRGIKANDVPDIHMAALALEHGLTLCSSDRGFARFDGLRWMDPLQDAD